MTRSARYWGKPGRRDRWRPTTLQAHFMLEAYLHGLVAIHCPVTTRKRLLERKIWEESSPTRINPEPMLMLTKAGLGELFRHRPDLRWS